MAEGILCYLVIMQDGIKVQVENFKKVINMQDGIEVHVGKS